MQHGKSILQEAQERIRYAVTLFYTDRRETFLSRFKRFFLFSRVFNVLTFLFFPNARRTGVPSPCSCSSSSSGRVAASGRARRRRRRIDAAPRSKINSDVGPTTTAAAAERRSGRQTPSPPPTLDRPPGAPPPPLPVV